MTDREFFELAAKASGIENIGYSASKGIARARNGACLTHFWNPLTDDGDALRLAVKLRLHVEWRADGRVAVSPAYGESGIYEIASSREDTAANLRRAITRAAAQIQLDKEKQ